ncbi:MAG: HEAT repeat domain-containing protein [Austwickia sp.]|nr:HEAT repeat domain-containing protein [Austwickia sp.]MBK8437737.1 HEAT repeat domain-containing protein [Austwickia sp.]
MQDDIEADVRALARARDVFAEDEARAVLRRYGDAVAPYLAAEYDHSTAVEARAHLIHHSIPFARRRSESYRLGLHGLADRSKQVRHEACALLAYAQRPEAMSALEELLEHPDPDTRDDAVAALVALETGNHHYYRDRDRTDAIFWVVNPEDDPHVEEPDLLDRLTGVVLAPVGWLRDLVLRRH